MSGDVVEALIKIYQWKVSDMIRQAEERGAIQCGMTVFFSGKEVIVLVTTWLGIEAMLLGKVMKTVLVTT
jgi:hypothetical protein